MNTSRKHNELNYYRSYLEDTNLKVVFFGAEEKKEDTNLKAVFFGAEEKKAPRGGGKYGHLRLC